MSIAGWLAIEVIKRREAEEQARRDAKDARRRIAVNLARRLELETFAETGVWVTATPGLLSITHGPGDLR